MPASSRVCGRPAAKRLARARSSAAAARLSASGGSAVRAPTLDVLGRAGATAAFAPAQAARSRGRQHQRERAGERGAVLLGKPLGECDQIDGKRGRPSSNARNGASSFSSETSLWSASAVTTPRISRRPNGTTSIEPTSRPRCSSCGQAIVERPAQHAGRRHRLDLGDRGHRHPNAGAGPPGRWANRGGARS